MVVRMMGRCLLADSAVRCFFVATKLQAGTVHEAPNLDDGLYFTMQSVHVNGLIGPACSFLKLSNQRSGPH